VSNFISIVIPSLNQGIYLEDCIKSILDQDISNYEIIMMDGGSTDISTDIIEKYQSEFSHIQSCKDNGQVAALNDAFNNYCKGNILFWLNSDDKLATGALSHVLRLDWENTSINYGRAYWLHENDSTNVHPCYGKRNLFKLLLYWKYFTIPQCSTFMTADLFSKIGNLNTELELSFDYEYWIRCICYTSTMHFCDKFLSYYRLHNKAKTVHQVEQAHKELDILSRSNRWRLPLTKQLYYFISYWISKSEYIPRNRIQ